ncbi:TonB-dependent receptor [Longitalea luteola]|uniref:TonB-dependent receptor n=1 Tax=Longitalea luteola TaxID=2812563 RepID=UPI001A96207A|nr:TonB-dependent receptor [Longitalea luteola]
MSELNFRKRHSRVVWTVIHILLLASLAQTVLAQEHQLPGVVVDEQRKPIPGVQLSLQPGNILRLSDSSGHFVFVIAKAGTYTLTASKEGYSMFTKTYAAGNQFKSIRIVLHPIGQLLEEVIVKDRHEEERRQTEALTIDIVNKNFIQRHLGGSLMQTLSRLPGIKTIGIGSGQSKPLIRGLGFNRVVVIDKGVKHEGQQWGADHGLEIDQFAANEVELIKGAASFVYGSDAVGGAIDLKPAPPPPLQTFGGSVDILGKTNNNLYGTSTNLYGRNQRLFFDARFTYQNYGDYKVPADSVFVYDYGVALHQNKLRNTAGRETGLHLNTGYVSDKSRTTFYISNTYSKSGFFANAHGLEPRRVDAAMHDASSRDILMPRQQVNHFKVINRSSYTKGVHSWEAEIGYQHNKRKEYSQYVNHGYMPPSCPDTLGVSNYLERAFDKHVYSINFRDEISLGKHSLKIGVNGEHQQNTIAGWTFLVPAFRQSTLGAFAYDKYSMNDRVILHGAVRYDHGQIRLQEYRDWFPSGDGPDTEYLVRAAPLTRKFNSLVWSAGINYNLEQFELKANIGKSFRIPIAKELGANGVNYHYFSYEKGNASLDPEQSYQADFSLAWKARRWSVKLSPFYNYFPNYIYLNPTSQYDYFYGAGNQVFEYAQSRVMRYGGEVEINYNILPALRVGLLGEYLYAEQLSGNKKGYTLPFSPPPSGLLNLSWSPTLRNGVTGTYFSVDYRLTAPQNNIVPPEKKTPGYQVVNVQAGTRLTAGKQPLMVSLQAQNLFNTRYLNHTSFYRLIELPEAGRNIILSLKIPFRIRSSGNSSE